MSKLRLFSAIVSVLLLLASGCAGVDSGAKTGLDLARSEAAQRNVPVLLDFYTDW